MVEHLPASKQRYSNQRAIHMGLSSSSQKQAEIAAVSRHRALFDEACITHEEGKYLNFQLYRTALLTWLALACAYELGQNPNGVCVAHMNVAVDEATSKMVGLSAGRPQDRVLMGVALTRFPDSKLVSKTLSSADGGSALTDIFRC